MLSHLRFHRRGPSNPSSPGPDQPPGSPLSAQHSPYPLDGLSPHEGRPPSSSSSALPPTLPPITRVTTDETDLRLSSPPREADYKITAPVQHETRAAPQMARSPYNADSGFIGGVALRKYQRDMQAQTSGRPEPADKPPQPAGQDNRQPSFAPPQRPAPIDTDVLTRPPPQVTALAGQRPASSFSTPTDLQNTTTATGRRPAGTRLATEPPAMPAPTESLEPQRGKRSLPFLKNPMSTLLARRKNNQNVPDLSPLQTEEPFNDPRIRGTRVHDFSAPRRKNNAPSDDPKLSQSTSHSTLASAKDRRPSDTLDRRENVQPGGAPPRGMGSATGSARSGSISAVSQTIPESQSFSPESANELVRQMPPDPPDRSAPPVPPKDDVAPSLRSIPSKASRISTQGRPAEAMASASTRTARSRNISLSDMSHRDTISSIPKHMKSTSSRFSFDMIGAAKQEKLLEERHRQREIEKQTTDDDDVRDSRFDDFDDDGFDYDAMMDDDGLEERIPGVNADYEEDDYLIEEEIDLNNEQELDPDNDQENFSGFVFQRSDPTSLVTSPHSAGMMATPRDDEGNVIGFATSRDTPNLSVSPLVADARALAAQQGLGAPATGLGIQGTSISEQPEEDGDDTAHLDCPVPPGTAPRNTNEDELYFDGGAMGFGDEFADELAFGSNGEGEPFDESIFDNNDTDRFGRPVPGAFAQAQSSRREAQQGSLKRESDMTSRFSAQSGISRSTAHTSMSYDARPPRNSKEEKTSSPPAVPSDEASAPVTESGQVVDYQAALAAAAYKAAASGKFQRTSSPPPLDGRASAKEPAGGPNRSPMAEVSDGFDEGSEENFDDYGQSYEDMDDFELDDDAIIAEANASALANDSDGWYGQEFGFYSGNGHGNSGPVDYEYANGGFFGPKGMNGVNRSTSGRNISREPNLTPITERSEYSNRNSVMSLGMPPFAPGTPIQSPGLAQLAMMADRGDDQMTLSALLRLRSRAWGGSQASLVSSKDGSPKSERGDAPSSPWGPHSGSFPVGGGGHMRKNSVVSMLSRESDAGSPPGSPTLTGGIPDLLNYEPPPPVPGQDGQSASQNWDDQVCMPPPPKPKPQPLHTNNPTTTEANDRPLSAISQASSTEWNRTGGDSARTSMSSRRPGMGHRHKGSADSISYMMEEDSGETRWVMERRRTGESGQVEILEREVVEGGRI